MIVKRFDKQFGTVQCAISLFDSATVVARPALNESAQLGSSTILEYRCLIALVRNSKQNTMADGDGAPPRSKTVKRIRYEQKFKPEYCSKFKFILKSRVGETRVFFLYTLSIGYLHHARWEGRHKKHAESANQLVFCFVSTLCLIYYFLLCLDPNLTIAIYYLAMLAGLDCHCDRI